MADFYTYVRKTAMNNTQDWHDHYNEVIIMTLSLLAPLVRNGDDALIITDAQILAVKAGEACELMEIADHEQACKDAKAQHKEGFYTSFREAMRLIAEHDERIRQHFQLVEELPEAVTYRIISES